MNKQGTTAACVDDMGSQEVAFSSNFMNVLDTFAYLTIVCENCMKNL
jgi:hypothetical protein